MINEPSLTGSSNYLQLRKQVMQQEELGIPNIPAATIRLKDINEDECSWKVMEKMNYFMVTGTFRKGMLVITKSTNVYKVEPKLVSMLQFETNTTLCKKVKDELCIKMTEQLQQYALVIRERII